jgi:hypothetical protein
MKESRTLLILALPMLIFFLTGCGQSTHQGYKKTSSGLYYKIYTPENKDTAVVEVGKIVTLDMKYLKSERSSHWT